MFLRLPAAQCQQENSKEFLPERKTNPCWCRLEREQENGNVQSAAAVYDIKVHCLRLRRQIVVAMKPSLTDGP